MKKVITLLLILSFIFSLQIVKADGDPDKPLLNKYKKTDLLSKKEVDYIKAKREFDILSGAKIVDFYADFQLGVSGTSANVSSAPGVGDYSTKSKLGYKTGVAFYLSLFDMFSFSTGISFNGKSFELTNPNYRPPVADSSFKPGSSLYLVANYLNVPLNFHVGGMVTENVGFDFNGGPYLGILMSSPNNVSNGSGFKNFDLGLNGTLTGSYVIQYPLKAILGVDFQYGGLNNLGKTALVDRISTINYSLFSGLRIAL